MGLHLILKKILNDIALERREKSGSIVLIEKMNDQPDMTVEVLSQDEPLTAIRLSKFSHFSVLKSDNSRTQKCDYLLIVELEGIIHAIFIEMKKTFTQGKGPKEQLRRSRPFLAYLLSVCEIENELILDPQPIEKYVIIAEKFSEKFDKQPVNVKQRSILKEQYKGIDIAKIVSTTVSLADLTNS